MGSKLKKALNSAFFIGKQLVIFPARSDVLLTLEHGNCLG